jgi:transcriptional regulator with PAS, ATPase and Fis domain
MARIKYKEAAGLKVKRGRPSSKKPSKAELRRLYVRESKSIREVAEILGCSKDMIYRCLKEYGIERRARVPKSSLAQYEIQHLREMVGREGYNQTAEKLGVGRAALWMYIKRREGVGD